MVEYLDRFARTREPLDAKPLSVSFSLDVISSCAFGFNPQVFKNTDSEFRKNIDIIIGNGPFSIKYELHQIVRHFRFYISNFQGIIECNL